MLYFILQLKFSANCIGNGRKCSDWCICCSSSVRAAIWNLWVNISGPITIYEPYKWGDISCKNTFGVKMTIKTWPSKSRIIPGKRCTNRLATTRSDIRMWQRLSILNTYCKYCTGHILAINCFHSFIRLTNLVSAIFC